jgi:DNA polymerase-4
LAKQLMQQVEFFDKQSGYAERHTHPIRLLGLGVSNQKIATPQEENQWIELELEFEPWPEK